MHLQRAECLYMWNASNTVVYQPTFPLWMVCVILLMRKLISDFSGAWESYTDTSTFRVLLSLTSVEDFIRLQYTAGITSYSDTVSRVFRYFHVIQWCLYDCKRFVEILTTDKNHSIKKKCIPFCFVKKSDKIWSNKKLCLLFLSIKWRVQVQGHYGLKYKLTNWLTS